MSLTVEGQCRKSCHCGQRNCSNRNTGHFQIKDLGKDYLRVECSITILFRAEHKTKYHSINTCGTALAMCEQRGYLLPRRVYVNMQQRAFNSVSPFC
jgi:hypothetical protein